MQAQHRLLPAIALSLCLAVLGTAQARPAYGQCASALTPGPWAGPITVNITAQGTTQAGAAMSLSNSVTSSVSLQVACDGSVTGRVSDRMDVQISARSLSAACTGTSTLTVTGGTAAIGAGNLPVLTLNGSLQRETFSCTGDAALAGILNQAFAGAGNQPYSATYTLQATAATSNTISGTEVKTDDPGPTQAMADLAARGLNPVRTVRWQLTGPEPAATNTPEPDAPVITNLQARYLQYFLQGVRSVPNEYTATVNWKNGTPGRVVFTLGADPSQTFNAPPYTLKKEMGDLPGSAVLTVVATSGEGKSSPPRQMAIDIVPLPAWAQRLSFAAVLNSGYVLYRSQQPIPGRPFTGGYIEVNQDIPFFGGPYGFLPFQLNANLTVDSRGQQGQDRVTGLGGAAWGKDKQVDLTIEGDTFTSLTATQMNFDRGQANVSFPPVSYEKYYGLVDLIPGAREFYSLPFVGRIVQALNELASIGGQVTATVGGQGSLGIKNNQLDATSGQFDLGADVVINILRLGISQAYVAVGGGGRGTLAVGFVPDWRLAGCSVSLYLRAVAYAFGYQSEARTQPWNYACSVSGLILPRHGLASAPAMVLRVPARTRDWTPEHSTLRTSTAQNITTTTLVEGASLDAAPAFARSSAGQAAFAWAAEDPARPRAQANEIRLRIYDGTDWGDPINLTANTRPDFNPQVAFAGNDRILVAWVQDRLDDLPADSTLDDRFLQHLEIAYAVIESQSGAVVGDGLLTNDGVLDFDVRLAAGRDGTVWAVWQSSPQLNAVGQAGAPNQLHAAAWDGTGWSPVETVTDQLAGTLWWSTAAQSREAVLVAADGIADNISTDASSHEILVFERTSSGWTARRLTQNTTPDLAPRLTYTPEGKPVLAWYSQGAIMGMVGDLGSQPAAWFNTAPETGVGLSGGSLLAGANGELALVWPGSAPNGPNVWLARYEPTRNSWNTAAPIFDGAAQETNLSATFRVDGTLMLGLSQIAVAPEAVPAAEGQTVNIPALADTADLVVVEVPGVFAPQSASTTPSMPGWLPMVLAVALAAAVLVGAAIVAGVLMMRGRARR